MAYESFADALSSARGMQHQPVSHEVTLDNRLDELQKGIVDRGLTSQLIQFSYEFIEGAITGLDIFLSNAPFKFEIIDVVVQAQETEGSGTMKLVGAGDITDLITCDTEDEINRVATIDVDNSIIAEGGSLEVVCVGGTIANIKALVTILAVAR